MHRAALPPLTIWAARTFGTAAHSLAALRHNPDHRTVRLLVSHVRAESPTLGTADRAFLEPPLTGPAWVGWALEVCERENVDVLWVTHEAVAAAAAREAFAAVGTRLLLPSAGALLRTSAKSEVYRRAEAIGLPTPPWERIVGVRRAKAALRRLERLSPHGVCVKPDSGQGAVGVWRLVPGWDDLPSGVDLPLRLWLAHVRRNPDAAWLVLPWLPGAEHSVDALRSRDGRLLASVVRTKRDSSSEQVASSDPRLTTMSAALLENLAVSPLANVQWRDQEGSPVLLEVNPRPSAGLFRSSQALGIDLLWAAIRQEVLGDAGLASGPVALADGVVLRTTSLASVVPMAVLTSVAPAAGPAALPSQLSPRAAEQLSP
ncbi:MAG: hypothetical protein QOF39_1293 [Frankiales bacterium]|nr:hypothetical protein [Frankiales bacterium]